MASTRPHENVFWCDSVGFCEVSESEYPGASIASVSQSWRSRPILNFSQAPVKNRWKHVECHVSTGGVFWRRSECHTSIGVAFSKTLLEDGQKKELCILAMSHGSTATKSAFAAIEKTTFSIRTMVATARTVLESGQKRSCAFWRCRMIVRPQSHHLQLLKRRISVFVRW